jgi:lycopene cyclase domain-containing protein
MSHWTYLALNALTISVPLLRSFEPRVHFARRFRSVLVATALTGAVFLPWDILFTRLGVWSFDHRYVVGVYVAGLPVEEWLFFFTVPFACLFVYEVLSHFLVRDPLARVARAIFFTLGGVLLLFGLASWGKLYTATTFMLTGALCLFVAARDARYLGRFLVAFSVCLVPFFLVNGALTGSFTDAPVVRYDDTENLGIRLGTIPLEDAVYMLLLLLMNVSWFEWSRATGAPLAQGASAAKMVSSPR